MKCALILSVCVSYFLIANPNAMAEKRHCSSLTPRGSHERPIDPPPVQQDLTFLGRGIQMRHADERIALACVDETCSRVRFVHFQDRENAVWIGQEIVLPDFQDPELQKKANDLVVNGYLLDRRVVSEGFLSGSAAGTAYIVLALTLPGFFPEVNALLLMGAAVSPILFYEIGRLFVGSLESKVVSQDLVFASRDQNGWNWSEDPAVVGRSRFERYYDNICGHAIDYSSPAHDFGPNSDKVRNSYKKAWRKIDRKMKRLKARDAK